MERNPYEALAVALSGNPAMPPAFRRGTVTKMAPLTVRIAGVEMTGNIWVNPDLLPSFPAAHRVIRLLGHVSLISGEVTTEADIQSDDLREWTMDALIGVGDEVLLLSEGDQSFILLCKVVRP